MSNMMMWKGSTPTRQHRCTTPYYLQDLSVARVRECCWCDSAPGGGCRQDQLNVWAFHMRKHAHADRQDEQARTPHTMSCRQTNRLAARCSLFLRLAPRLCASLSTPLSSLAVWLSRSLAPDAAMQPGACACCRNGDRQNQHECSHTATHNGLHAPFRVTCQLEETRQNTPGHVRSYTANERHSRGKH